MSKPVFFSNTIIDTWSEGKKITIQNNLLTVHKAPGVEVRFVLDEACRFVKTSDGAGDPNALIGKVRTKGQLDQMGAELYMNSCIYKDVAYDVEQGYIGRPMEGEAKATPPPIAAPIEEKVDAAPKESKTDEDLLTSFLLNHMK